MSTRQKKVAVRVKMNFVSFRFLKLNFSIQGMKADRDKKVKDITINYYLSSKSCDRKTLLLLIFFM